MTSTEAEPDLAGSALLVAITKAVPGLNGAVKSPEDVMVPRETHHVTVLSDVVACTVAVKGSVRISPLVFKLAEDGETVTELTAGVDDRAAP
jgi:hypothetical protein